MGRIILFITISLLVSSCGVYESYQYTAEDGVEVNLVYMPGCGSTSHSHESQPYNPDQEYDCSSMDFIEGFHSCAIAKRYCVRDGHRYKFCTCGIIPKGGLDCTGSEACSHENEDCRIDAVKCVVADENY